MKPLAATLSLVLLSCPASHHSAQLASEQISVQSEARTIESLSEKNLSDDVRELIRPGCGSCHTSSLSTAKPGAIRVFDLDKTVWAMTMTVDQLGKFKGRLNKLTGSSSDKVVRFVNLELDKRMASGSAPQ